VSSSLLESSSAQVLIKGFNPDLSASLVEMVLTVFDRRRDGALLSSDLI